jgi:anti-sigma factor RsiW
MNCDRTGTVLHCYHDNELDALGAAQFERHLKHCTECTDALAALKSLRSAFNDAQLYQNAPASLRKTVLASVSSPRPRFVVPARMIWRSLAVAATFFLLACIGWYAASVTPAGSSETLLAAEVIDAHLRSLQPGHLIDVISSDQHTVKPWFDGKLDFSPPVRDFADRGFPLKGGRLDVIHGRAIAALVYGRRKHLVSVFIWPTTEQNASARSGSRQGYQWLDWRIGGMELCIVSDTSLADLEQLQQALAQ